MTALAPAELAVAGPAPVAAYDVRHAVFSRAARPAAAIREGATVAIQCALLSRRGGGLPAAVLPLAGRLAPHRPRLVTFDPPEEAPALDVAVARAGRLPFASDAGVLLEGADIVHTHGLWTALSFAALAHARRTGVPLVVSPHGMLDPWALGRSHWRKRATLALAERRHLDRAAVVHALSASEAAAIRALGVRAPIAVVPNGVDPAPVVLPEARPAWIDRPTLLFLGRLHAKKGLSELIAAWSLAAPALPGWQLAIAGWDDGANGFRAEAARSAGRIVFPGPLFGADKAAAYANAAAFVLPSRSEGLPIAVLEAWSHGRPVLMSAACNLPEGFAAGAAVSITAEPGGFARTLVAHLSDEGWRAAAGSAGRRLAGDAFYWDRIAATWRAVYDWALSGGARPAAIHD